MNRFLNKMERKLGRFAVPNLIFYVLLGYAVGALLRIAAPQALYYMTLEPYYILRGQVWRLFTWVLMPPNSNLLFIVIMVLFYFQLGQALEHAWGTFRFNVYIFGGMLFTVIGAFLLYGIYYLMNGVPAVGMGGFFTTDYINMSIFLAFAMCFPEMQVMLYFIVPIKMKWLAAVYAALILFSLLQTNWAGRVAIIMSLLNFIVFYLSVKDFRRVSPKEIHRRQKFKAQMRQAPTRPGVTKHKCAVCGRTEQDDPNLEFRFCSKCEGNYEYCQEHLFTHTHVKR